MLLLALVVATAPLVRADLPITEVDLSDGTRRYSIPLTVAGRPVAAGLDTGSVGLRLLPDAAAGTIATTDAEHYFYGVGTTLDGVIAVAPLAANALTAEVRVEKVTIIGCTAARLNCPAGKVAPANFGIQGNGLPGEGFRAIAGVGMAHATLPNPLVALGAHRWIVQLPRPGSASPGHIVLNPRDDETTGFVALPMADPGDRRNDAVAACLAHADGSAAVCAPTLIDTGAPGIEMVNRKSGGDWSAGSMARLAFGPAAAPVATMGFPIGSRAAGVTPCFRSRRAPKRTAPSFGACRVLCL